MLKIQQYLIHNLKLYRKNRGLTQEKLAILSDTATNYIGLIETGKRFPSYDLLQRLADSLNIDVYKLFIPIDKIDTFSTDVDLRKNKLIELLSDEITKTITKTINNI